jgi:hypothetical protein
LKVSFLGINLTQNPSRMYWIIIWFLIIVFFFT